MLAGIDEGADVCTYVVLFLYAFPMMASSTSSITDVSSACHALVGRKRKRKVKDEPPVDSEQTVRADSASLTQASGLAVYLTV